MTFAESTKWTYDTHRRAYLKFCLSMGYNPVFITKLQLARFAVHLAPCLKPQSLRKYLNIVWLLHIEVNLPNPLENNWFLQLLLTGIKRDKVEQTVKKLPIMPHILLQIRKSLDLNAPELAVFWAIALLLSQEVQLTAAHTHWV